jgi:hypothetical protein
MLTFNSLIWKTIFVVFTINAHLNSCALGCHCIIAGVSTAMFTGLTVLVTRLASVKHIQLVSAFH